jgi:glycosyltransferase involved in cell wall biosynthesis
MNGIVMLINEFTPISGGTEKQAERLAAFMAKEGKKVWVITRRFSGLAAKEDYLGFTIIRPPSFGPGKLKTISFVLGTLAHLWRLRKQYQVLHAHMLFGAAFSALLTGKLLKKATLVKLGSSGPTGEIAVSRRSSRGRVRLALLRRWADKVIVLDEKMSAEAIAVGIPPEKIIRISNGIDAKQFETLETKKSSAAVEILFIGRFVPEKSLQTLLKAYQKALQDCSKLHLTLVGDGTERKELENLASTLGIAEKTTFAGKQSDVRPYLAAADIFVLPSKSEGMSNALLEGMAAGLPCLATPVGAGPRVLGAGKYGVLLPVGDTDAWAQALVELGRNPQQRAELGKAAQKRILSEYDFSIIGARYLALYETLSKGTRHG